MMKGTSGWTAGMYAFRASEARAAVRCDSLGNACFLSQMPLYSQNDPALADLFEGGDPNQSMLCVPTAASMALATALAAGESPRSWSWSAKSFAPGESAARTGAMSKLMWTTASSGTSLGIEQYPLRAWDFAGYRPIHDQAWFRRIDDALVRDRLAEGSLTILNYGHYEENCRSTLGGGIYLCTYLRKGGHEVTVNGTSVEQTQPPFVSVTRIYDPWYAQVRSVTLQKVPNKSFMKIFGNVVELPSLPYLGNTRAWKMEGVSFKIIDRLDSLKTGD
jgi:hypothetical protein